MGRRILLTISNPAARDHIVIKRRDSAFHDTEIDVWLKSLGWIR